MRLSKQPEEIGGSDLIAELGITSIDALEILINVEIEFGIEVDDEDLSAALVSSLGNLGTYVERRLSAEAG